jgi:hypothetical protein
LRERFRPVAAPLPGVTIDAVSLALYDELGTVQLGGAA